MKFEELAKKSKKDLIAMFNANIKSLFIKRSTQASGGSVKAHEIRNLKKDSARIKTALRLLDIKKS